MEATKQTKLHETHPDANRQTSSGQHNIFRRVPGLIIKVNTELTATDKLLDENELFCMIRNDLARRHPQTDSRGRKSTPVEVLLRMMAVKHPYDFGYEKTKQQVANSLVLSQFYRVYFHAVPDHTTLWCWAQLIQPGTLAVFLQ